MLSIISLFHVTIKTSVHTPIPSQYLHKRLFIALFSSRIELFNQYNVINEEQLRNLIYTLVNKIERRKLGDHYNPHS